jgi:lipopolysaccharide export LptBFGC system permease protein LptF
VNILDRYLYRTVLVYTAMAMAVLLTLGALFVFISQQGDIGVGSYSAGDAFLFTLLNLPQQAFELLPIGAMIGALMGLGNLAYRLARGPRRDDSLPHDVRHRRVRGAAAGAVRETRKDHG